MSTADLNDALSALTSLDERKVPDDQAVEVRAGDLRRLLRMFIDAHIVELELNALRRIVADGAEVEKPFFAIRRADGELIYGEYAWMGADASERGGFLWDPAEESDDDEPVEWQVCKMLPVVVERRRYQYGRWIDDPDREPDEDDDDE